MKKTFLKIWKVLKGTLNVGWKAGVTVIALCLVYGFCDEYWSDINLLFHPWETTAHISSKVSIRENRNKDYVQLFDRETGKKLSRDKYLRVFEPNGKDSLTVFIDIDGKRGFLNANTGKTVIPAQYRHAWQFNGEDLAAVVGFQDDSLRFIGRNGAPAFDKAFAYVLDEDYVFHNGNCIMVRKENGGTVYGLLGKDGEWILEQEYYYMYYEQSVGLFYVSQLNEDDVRRQGYWNPRGYWEYEPIYDKVNFNNADNTVFITENGIKRQVKPDGTVVEPFVIDYVSLLEYTPTGESNIEVDGDYQKRVLTNSKVAKYSCDYKCGLLDLKTGKPLTPAVFDDIYAVSEDILRCELVGLNFEVLYNSKGQKIN